MLSGSLWSAALRSGWVCDFIKPYPRVFLGLGSIQWVVARMAMSENKRPAKLFGKRAVED